jgi:non-ribosomal peptide synthetase component F
MAFAVVLAWHSGQSDLVIGSPIANRQHADLEPLLGFFVNTLALRIDLSGQPSFRELVRRVRQVALEAYTHQDLPFERLVDELQPERDLSRSALFQVMLALQNMPLEITALRGLRVSPLQLPRGAALFDLVLDFWDTADGLHGVLDYDCALFEPASAERMMGHLQLVLRAFAADAETAVDAVPLLDAAESEKVLALSNGAAFDYPLDRGFAAAFEEQAARSKQLTAACAGAERL